MTARVRTEAVWELLSAKLKSFIRSRVENEQAAADILQETFLRIHQRLGGLSDAERVEAWVYQIARSFLQIELRIHPFHPLDRQHDHNL